MNELGEERRHEARACNRHHRPIRGHDRQRRGGKSSELAGLRALKSEIKAFWSSEDAWNKEFISGTIRQTVFSGNSVTYIVTAGDETVRVFAQNRGDQVFGVGDAVSILWSARHSVTVKP